MNLQVTRYSTIHVKCGIDEYPDEIALKYPSIFQKVEEEKHVVETDIEEEKHVIEETENIIEENIIEENILYDKMSYKELKVLIKEANIIIDGRKTKKKMISALKNRK